MDFKVTEPNDLTGEYKFIMMYQGKIAFGNLIYIPGNLGGLGSYNLKLDMLKENEKVNVRNITFVR